MVFKYQTLLFLNTNTTDPRVHAMTGTTIQKFGTQTEKGRVVLCFRNGDKHQTAGTRMIIHPTKIKTFDQFKTEMSRKVGLPTGPVLKVYSRDHKQVKSLEEFVDGEKYICCGAEKLNLEQLAAGLSDEFDGETTPAPPSASDDVEPPHQQEEEERKPVVSSYSKGTPEKFGTQTEKGRIIVCFRNGDKHQKDGARIVIHPTKIKTFDQLKTELSRKVGLPTGPVLKVYGADRKQVKTLEDFVDGERYICTGAERLDEAGIPAGMYDDEQQQSLPTSASYGSVAQEERQPVVKSYSGKTPEKFGTQTEKGRVVVCFRNGDKHQKDGIRVVIHPTKIKTFDQFKTEMSRKVALPTGPVLKVYGRDHKQVKSLDDFVDGERYICAGAEKLNLEAMPAGFEDHEQEDLTSATSSLSLSPSYTSPEDSSEKKPVVQSYVKGVPEKFGTQTDKGKVITVFRNGDKHHEGVRMTVHPTKFKTYAQLMEAMTKQVQLSTGAVRKVYAVEGGRKVGGMEEIEDGGRYVATGAEPLNIALMPIAAKE